MDYFSYANSFSITDNIVISVTNGMKIPTIIDCIGQDKKTFILLNDILLTYIEKDYFDEIKCKILYELNKSNLDGFLIGAFTKNEIPFIEKNFKIIPSIQSFCEISEWTSNSKVNRCVKRSYENGIQTKVISSKEDICTGLSLVKNMDF